MANDDYLIPVFEELLAEKPYLGRMSNHLRNELVRSDSRTFKAVLKHIDFMEGLPGAKQPDTVKPKKFRGPILGPLSKFHYTTTAFLPLNVLNQWTSKGNQQAAQAAGQQFDNAVNSDISHTDAWELAGQLAEQIVAGYGVRQAKRALTGEWVIYRNYAGVNYYLSLAVHAELSDEQALFDRVKRACPEFPFCFL